MLRASSPGTDRLQLDRGMEAVVDRDLLHSYRLRLHHFDTLSGGSWFFAEEFDPLLLHHGIMLFGLDRFEEAIHRALEPFLPFRVAKFSVVAKCFMRLGEGKHVGINARTEMFHWNS